MNDFSNKLAKYLYSRAETTQVSVEVYKYSVQVMLEMLAGILASICMAVYLDMKLECLVFLVMFSVLRSYAGGVHLDEFRHCFLFSTIITIIVLVSVKYCRVPVGISGTMMGVSSLLLWMIPAGENENRAVTEEESAWFKTRLMRAVAAVLIFFIAMLICGNYRYAFLVSLTTAVTTVLMLIGKWKDEYKKRG